MKLALDTQVSRHVAEKLRNYGYEIVYHARHEHDELWLSRALNLGAEVFISPDWDVDIFCNKVNKKCIRLRQFRKHDDVFVIILKQLKHIKGTK